MAVLVGTSGWQYVDWRGGFYPADLPKRAWLGFLATRFPTVEVNNSFYRLPSAEAFARWREETPEGFRGRRQGQPVHHPHPPDAGLP